MSAIQSGERLIMEQIASTETFWLHSIYQVLPEIIKLWGLNIQTEAESKKTSQK